MILSDSPSPRPIGAQNKSLHMMQSSIDSVALDDMLAWPEMLTPLELASSFLFSSYSQRIILRHSNRIRYSPNRVLYTRQLIIVLGG